MLRLGYCYGIIHFPPGGTVTREERPMKETKELWVVYLMTLHGKETPMNVVCEQREWDRMELMNPGHHRLIRGGIATEREAELLARGTSGDTPRKEPGRTRSHGRPRLK